MLCLAVDSSGKSLSVALLEDERILAERVLNLGYTHSQTMLPQIMALLADCERKFSDLDLLAAAAGPGSYTGIRIGLASMQTLAWQSQIPLLGLSSLEAMAAPWRKTDALVMPAVDARSGRAFTALYQGGKLVIEEANRTVSEHLLEWSEVIQQLTVKADETEKQKVLLLGDGSKAVLEAVNEVENADKLAMEFILIDPEATALRASELGKLAVKKWRAGTASEEEKAAEARYLSPSQAERMRQKQQ